MALSLSREESTPLFVDTMSVVGSPLVKRPSVASCAVRLQSMLDDAVANLLRAKSRYSLSAMSRGAVCSALLPG